MAENAIISDLEFAPQLTDDMVLPVEDTQNTYSTTLGQLRAQLNKVFVEIIDVDFDLLVDDGFYQASGTLSHTPVVGSIVWLVQVVKEGNAIVQTASSIDLENFLNIYKRRYDGTKWSDWTLIAGKLDFASPDLGNISEEGKESIVNNCMPDYDSGVQISFPYTPIRDGIIIARMYGWNSKIAITDSTSGKIIAQMHYRTPDRVIDWYSLTCFVKKGRELTMTSEALSNSEYMFYPMTGAK